MSGVANIMISVIIPVYNEEKTIGLTLCNLCSHPGLEIIVVDGGSTDRTSEIVRKYPVKLVRSVKNRAVQMNDGSKMAAGDILLFLHADCRLPENSLAGIEDCAGRKIHRRLFVAEDRFSGIDLSFY